VQTAAVALPLLILLILKGGVVLFTCFVLLLSGLGLAEFYRMAFPEWKREGLAASMTGALLPLAFLRPDRVPFLCALTVLVILSCLLFLFRIRDIRQSAGEAALFLMGFLYVPLLLGHLVLLRGLPHGVSWIFLLIVIVMAGDTGA
jgi:phosphatidate cytidylyltransferase